MSGRLDGVTVLLLLVSVAILAYLVWLGGGELELVGGRLDELELEQRRLISIVSKPRTRKAAADGDNGAT